MKDDRELKLMIIFLEHPGGLRFNELWNIVEERKIYSKETLSNKLKEWQDEGLIRKDDRHYMLGFTKAVADDINEICHESPKRVEGFFNFLFDVFESYGKKEAKLFGKLGIAYLAKEAMRIMYLTGRLNPYLFDKRIREIWLSGLQFGLDILAENIDKMTRKFYGIGASEVFLMGMKSGILGEIYMFPLFKEFANNIGIINSKINGLIESLQIPVEIKDKLKQAASKSFDL